MGFNNVLVGAACLAIGGAVGYGLRSSLPASVTGFAAAASVTNGKGGSSSGSAAFANGEGAPRKERDAGEKAAGVPLGERMKALLKDFSEGDARRALGKLSEAELQAALALVAAMPKSEDRNALLSSLYRAWAKLNPAAAWKAALAETGGRGQMYLGVIAGEVAKTRPSAALDMALSLGMGARRSSALQGVFQEWCKVDPAGAMAYLNNHPDTPSQNWGVGTALGEMAQKDPGKAATMALSLSDPNTRSYAISSVMSEWAQRDPKAALAWAAGLTNPKQRDDATSYAFRAWAEKDPQAAVSAAATIPDATTRMASLQQAWQSWLAADPAAAMRYLGQSGDDKLIRNLGWSLSGNGYFTQQETTDLVAAIPDSPAKQDMVNNVVNNDIWRGKFAEAVAMLNNLPDSVQRDWTVQQLGKKWAEADPAATAAWLKQQPDSSDRDLAVAGYASTLARSSPQAAAQWAESIPDEGVKSGALKNIAVRWLSSDPGRAEAWLAGVSDLSNDEKQELRESAKKNGPEINYSGSVKNRR